MKNLILSQKSFILIIQKTSLLFHVLFKHILLSEYQIFKFRNYLFECIIYNYIFILFFPSEWIRMLILSILVVATLSILL